MDKNTIAALRNDDGVYGIWSVRTWYTGEDDYEFRFLSSLTDGRLAARPVFGVQPGPSDYENLLGRWTPVTLTRDEFEAVLASERAREALRPAPSPDAPEPEDDDQSRDAPEPEDDDHA